MRRFSMTGRDVAIVLAGVWMMTLMGTVYSYSVFRAEIETTYSASTVQSGVPYMVSLLFYALSVMVVGRVMKPSRLPVFVIIGTVLVASGWVLSGFATSLPVLVLTYGVMMGTGVGTVYGVPIYVAQKRFPERSGTMSGIVLLGFGMSPLVTAPLARALLDARGLEATFVIFGVLTLVLQLPLALLFRSAKTDEVPKPSGSVRNGRKVFVRLYVLYASATAVGLMMIGLTYQTGAVIYGFDAGAVTLALSFFALMNGSARPVFGQLMDKKGLTWSVRLSLLLMAFAALVGIVNQGSFQMLFILSFALFWFNLGAWLSMMPAAVKAIYGIDAYARVYGNLFTAYGVGAVAGTLVSGLILDLFEQTTYVYTMVLVIVVMSLIVLGKGFSTHNNKKGESSHES